MQPIATGGGGVEQTLVGEGSHSLDLSGTATYTPRHDLSFQGTVDHRNQTYGGFGVSADAYSAGASYSRGLLGGTLATYGSITRYTANVYDQATTGGTGSISYSHRVGVWSGNTSFRYSRNAQTALITYTQSGYGYGLNIGRKLGSSWIWTVSANGSENRIDSVGNSSSFNQGYSTALSAGKISFNGNYSRSNGELDSKRHRADPDARPQPDRFADVVDPLWRKFLRRRSGVYADSWSGVDSRLFAFPLSHPQRFDLSENLLQQMDAKAEWYFRQLHFMGGYSRLPPGIWLAKRYSCACEFVLRGCVPVDSFLLITR